jgi:CRP-like cAMP-binding protein
MVRGKDASGARRGPSAAEASWSGTAELNYLELSFAKVPMFSACSTDELLRVSAATTIREAAAGDALIREGAAATEFFVILRGDARVTRGGAEVAMLGPGDFFGELALFDPAPRNATVTAVTPLSVAVLAQPAFHDVLAEPTIRDSILTGMARRLHELDGRA